MNKQAEDKEPGKREWMSFWSLVGMQSTNAFNDNFAKFILIPMGVALAAMGMAPQGMQYVLGLLMVLPFVILAPTAGWLGDRFAKHRVIRWSSWFQLFVLLLMGTGLWFGQFLLSDPNLLLNWVTENFGEKTGSFFFSLGKKLGVDQSSIALLMVLLAFFLLAVQSALLSPAKMGIVKELVGSNRLGFANGIMEGTVILAILFGQIVGGVWFDKWGLQEGLDPWMAAMVPVWWVLIGAVISLILSHLIQTTKAEGTEPYSRELAVRHFHDLGEVRNDVPLWRSVKGIAFFWGFGGFLQLLLIQVAQERKGSLAGMGVETAILWVPVVVGIVIGSVLASLICARKNELGLVVIGGSLMTLGMFLMPVMPEGWMSLGVLGISGCGGALFLVPLNAYMQDRAPSEKRGLVISASNLCNNLAGVFAVVLQGALRFLGVPSWLQFILVALICGWATLHIMRLLPRDFVRLIALGIFRSIYKVKVDGVENIPEKGGVLLVSNHMSYIDAIVLSSVCPRPIRFLMFADCFERKWIGKGARLFDTVPITPEKAKDAIRVAAEAVEEGSVVCIFPEGQLSRTGGLSELKRGYQMIAKRAQCPILPAYMDGLWGSIWSFAGGNFLKKYPRTIRYGVNVAFGGLMSPKDDLGENLRRLSTVTVAGREKRHHPLRIRNPKILGGLPNGYSGMLDRCWADDEAGRQMRTNALQLGQVNLASRYSNLLVEWKEESKLSGILGILWPVVIKAKVGFFEGGEIYSKAIEQRATCVILQGLDGRDELVNELAREGITVWSFDQLGTSDGRSFGCLVRDERVVTFAIPHPDYETTTQMPQIGWKNGSCGKLLPGFTFEGGNVSGPALPESIKMEGVEIDSEGFLS